MLPASLCLNAPSGAQCFPTLRIQSSGFGLRMSQCTFWCSVLSDSAWSLITGLDVVSMHLLVLSAFRHQNSKPSPKTPGVSMHLLVLSAFRREVGNAVRLPSCLNAPSGAQCFPTASVDRYRAACLKSQCTFWCSVLSDLRSNGDRGTLPFGLNAPSGAQCFPTVPRAMGSSTVRELSQCTFWCSVLSDLGVAQT
mgnify:CR=1 FL=1